MADYQPTQGGYAPYNAYDWDGGAEAEPAYGAETGQKSWRIFQLAGSVASVALVAGVMAWGYQTVMRDVSGVPVVAALSGPMRIAPENPGGRLADNMGLAVNEVVAAGANDAPIDQVSLAPDPVELSAEDTPVDATAAAAADANPFDQADLATEAGILALADQLSANVTPINVSHTADVAATETAAQAPALAQPRTETATPLTEAAPETASTEADAAEPARRLIAGGIARSIRPQLRPAGLKLASLGTPTALAAPAEQAVRDMDPTTLTSGTRLVQLGAYESDTVARDEWRKVSAVYPEFFEGKDRVIERAESGGRIFYRLRVHGFQDLADARRFCAVLVAGDDACIPAVVR